MGRRCRNVMPWWWVVLIPQIIIVATLVGGLAFGPTVGVDDDDDW